MEVVRALVAAGENLTNNDGFTALMLGSSGGHVEMVRFLLAAGVDKNSTSNGGVTALMVASQEGHEEVVDLLLQSGADQELCNKLGSTALMIAFLRRSSGSRACAGGERCRQELNQQ